MASAIIEEIEEGASDQRLQQLLDEHGREPKRFLETVFRFLAQRTVFFDDPDASKVLARLLRDVKKASGAAKPAPKPAASAQPAASTPPPSSVPVRPPFSPLLNSLACHVLEACSAGHALCTSSPDV